MQAADRVVSVVAGFGVWQGTRHLASARWIDVVGIRACADAGERVELTLALRDDTEVQVHESLPGYEAFLDAAEAALPTLRRRSDWLAGLHHRSRPTETVLFTRHAPRR